VTARHTFRDTVAIVAVDHEDDALRVLVVVAPQRTDLVLSSHIPHLQDADAKYETGKG